MEKDLINDEILEKSRALLEISGYIEENLKKIRDLEEQYNAFNSLKSELNSYIEQHNHKILNKLDKLDSESDFKEYYTSKLNAILNGNDRHRISTHLEEAQKNTLEKITACEELIKSCRNTFAQLEDSIEALKTKDIV